MTLAFFNVRNSKGYKENEFDMWCDRPQVIKEMLSELSDTELKMYDLDNISDVENYKSDFNDGLLCVGLGWRCVIIND